MFLFLRIVPFLILGCMLTPHTLAKTCKEKVEACAASQKDAITKAVDSFAFQDACKSYTEVVTCLHKLSDGDPNCNPYHFPTAFNEAKKKIHKYSNEMCGPDGSISGCAYEFSQCLVHANFIKAALESDPHSDSCKRYIQLDQCATLIQEQMVCPIGLEKQLLDMVTQIKKDITVLCFLTCDVAIDLCTQNLPDNLIGGMKMTEEDQEVLCAKLETAEKCIDATSVRVVCERENRKSDWTKALDQQKDNYNEFCSVPARTCTVEIQSCLVGAQEHIDWNDFASIGDLQAFCSELNDTIDCINHKSELEYCHGTDGAKRLADVINTERHLVDLYCGVGQCIFAFPDCYDLVTEVKKHVYNGDGGSTCDEVNRAINCSTHMEQFEPCLSLEFDNVTFSNAEVYLGQYMYMQCGAGQCVTAFSECYEHVKKVKKQAYDGEGEASCDDVERALNCSANMEQYEPCLALEFGNVTFSNVSTFLSEYTYSKCGAGQCVTAFPECYDLVTEVNKQIGISDSNDKPSCNEVERALNCSTQMEKFEPCLTLEFENVVFSNVAVSLSDYMYMQCGAGQCITAFPECYDLVTEVYHGDESDASCNDVERAVNCSAHMEKFEPCLSLTVDNVTFSHVSDSLSESMYMQCGAGQCITAFPECYDHVTEVKRELYSDGGKASCDALERALTCSAGMQKFAPCFSLEFDNITFTNVAVVLSTTMYMQCGAGQCVTSFPACYDLITKLKKQLDDGEGEAPCDDVDRATNCSTNMEKFGPCLLLKFDNVTFGNVAVSLSKYMDDQCVTCDKAIDKCTADVPKMQDGGMIITPAKQEALCKTLETTEHCLNSTDVKEVCEDENKTQKWLDAIACQKNDCNGICYVPQCRGAFLDCYYLVTKVISPTLSDAGGTPTCNAVRMAMYCAEEMDEYSACHKLGLYDTTAELSRNMSEHCAHKPERPAFDESTSECEEVFPECYADVVYSRTKAKTCSEAKVKRKCARSLAISLACRNSKHAQLFADTQERQSKYLSQHCTERNASPGLARSSHTLILASLVTAVVAVIKL